MPRVHVTGGYLNVAEMGPEGPVDPGFGGGIGAGHPGNALPPGVPPIGSTLPEPPPGVWPPINWYNPIQPLPPGDNTPPGTIWPPVGHPGHPLPPSPGHPDAGLPPAPARPGTGLPPSPGRPDAGLPVPPASTKPPSGTFWVVAGIPGVGWRYVCVDPSLEVGTPLPPTPEPK